MAPPTVVKQRDWCPPLHAPRSATQKVTLASSFTIGAHHERWRRRLRCAGEHELWRATAAACERASATRTSGGAVRMHHGARAAADLRVQAVSKG